MFLNNRVVMEYGNNIVGIATLQEETDKAIKYNISVASSNELGKDKIARYIKDLIGKSNKFSNTPSTKKRKYSVSEYECEILPITAEIKFNTL